MSSSHADWHLGGVVAPCMSPGHVERHTDGHQLESDWLLSDQFKTSQDVGLLEKVGKRVRIAEDGFGVKRSAKELLSDLVEKAVNVETIVEAEQKATPMLHGIRSGDSPYNPRVPGRKSIQPSGSRTKVYPVSGLLDENPYNPRFMKDRIHEPWVSEGCISKPLDSGKTYPGSSGFQESTTQGHPNIDCSLPPGADCNIA
ncbi:hypothetical protein F2Q68_00044314 [Brassica cretica]|uniref:Uncharacterized protein n=1 Tax=Brassica cretica TaxID=69181 RepID=A0A8S9LRJ6_BRACR|nr:hypothetical protein F2Q68_00044314 [Brassica cretica]